MDSNLIGLAAYFADEGKAIELIESIRWPDGPSCPHCGHQKAWLLPSSSKGKKSKRREYRCHACRQKFSVTLGTIFEDSHIPLNKWLAAIFLMSSSKKGISTNQLKRSLGITYKSAWFLAHRIRHAMDDLNVKGMLGGIVEVDETYIGGKGSKRRGRGAEKKVPVVALVQRDGKARSYRVNDVKGKTLKGLIRRNVEGTAQIMTDEFPSYRGLDEEFSAHCMVDHGKEYVRGIIHTNFAESYFSLLKRGIVGTFHHVSKEHMGRYLAEFNFRWNSRNMGDAERTALALRGIEGKRLMYRDSSLA